MTVTGGMNSVARIKSGPLTQKEREQFYRVLNDTEAFDIVLENALAGWRTGRAWKKIEKAWTFRGFIGMRSTKTET